jgi:hypothetical protein
VVREGDTMSDRVTHIIHAECDIYVQRVTKDSVRVRIVEKDPEIINPTDFEIEGDPIHIGEALASVCAVISHLETILQEPS